MSDGMVNIDSKTICYKCKNSMLVMATAKNPQFPPDYIGARDIETVQPICLKAFVPIIGYMAGCFGVQLRAAPEIIACQSFDPVLDDSEKRMATVQAGEGGERVQ